jgi:NO-binding membrane sensor protein with MHYT domain
MHGWRNHVILGLSVVCFATVAVWGMHFVGVFVCRSRVERLADANHNPHSCIATIPLNAFHNNMISKPTPLPQVSFQGFNLQPAPDLRWYLEFSPGFTAMSLFVPLVACWAAFYFLGNQDELKVWRICLAGIMCGGMSECRFDIG